MILHHKINFESYNGNCTYTWIQCFMLSLYSLSSSLNEWCKITVACSYLYSDAGEAKDTFDFHVLAAVVASRISYGKHAWVHVNILPSRRCLCYCGMNVKRERVFKHILYICIYMCSECVKLFMVCLHVFYCFVDVLWSSRLKKFSMWAYYSNL